MDKYHVEAECRDYGAQGKYEMRWFHNVAMPEMTTHAAVEALHALPDHNLDILRVRTVTQTQE